MAQVLNDDGLSRSSYRCFYPVTTRWHDNDVYGHINNVVYYSYFDTVANRYLIEKAGLDIVNGEGRFLVVASQCDYRASIAYPDQIEIGLRVNRLGTSSVQYGLGVFKTGMDSVCAIGTFTHVYVTNRTGKATSIPGSMRSALEAIHTL